jgi:hypothetical protein
MRAGSPPPSRFFVRRKDPREVATRTLWVQQAVEQAEGRV